MDTGEHEVVGEPYSADGATLLWRCIYCSYPTTHREGYCTWCALARQALRFVPIRAAEALLMDKKKGLL